MDALTICTLLFSAGYMFWTFAELLVRGVMLSFLVGVGVTLAMRAQGILVRHKRRIGNMIDASAQEFTS